MRHDRLWLLGGTFLAIVLVAFGFLFFIRPKQQDTDTIRGEAADAELLVAKQRRELAELAQQHEHIDEFRAALAKDQAALPDADKASDFLRELQSAGELTGVTVSGVSVGAAVDIKALVGFQVYALPVSLTVAGPTSKMNPFLDQLQVAQPRAVLISGLNFAPTTGSCGCAEKSNVTINLQAFYAPLS
ncbi:type 4a pilus biogenesis protein PilO [Dactylosporangium sp. NPDC051541]|uniref:type 4a pilus biogenesis protein PilO n=1 Tax=Dactylosporangium sp. NPDC051541 TaxID=3363977 RepID=UPI00379E45F7